ncbi:MAG: hypothetical protein V4719_00745 [Planctomycetota bacterium]
MTERTRQQMLVAERTRHILARSSVARRDAISSFPLAVASMASNLRRMTELEASHGGNCPAELEKFIATLEGKICDYFYETFGHEMAEEVQCEVCNYSQRD